MICLIVAGKLFHASKTCRREWYLCVEQPVFCSKIGGDDDDHAIPFPLELSQRKFYHESPSCCQQNSSTVELVDDTYDGRRVVTKRRQFIRHLSTVIFNSFTSIHCK